MKFVALAMSAVLAVLAAGSVSAAALNSGEMDAVPTWQELYLMDAEEKVAPVKKDLEIYNIRGNNYMKIRDLGYLMDFGVTYDHDLKGVSIIKGEHSDGIQVSNAKATEKQAAKTGWSPVFVDGQKIDGVTMYNIHGNNFVKIRDMAKAVGFGCIYSKDLKAVVLSPFFDYTANDVMTDGTSLYLRYNDGESNRAFAHKDVIKDTPVSIAKPAPVPTPKPTPTPIEKIYGAGEQIPMEAGHYKAQIAIGEKIYAGGEALGCDDEYMVDKRMDMNGLGAIGKVAGKTTLYVPQIGNPSNQRWITVELTITEAPSIPEEPVVPDRSVTPGDDYQEIREEIIRRTNEERVKIGQNTLIVDERIMNAAQMMAEKYANGNDMNSGHDYDMEDSMTEAANVGYGVVENLAYTYVASVSEASNVVDRWMKSPGHKRSMLGEAESIGVGCYVNPDTGLVAFVQAMGLFPVDPHTGVKITPQRLR